MSGMEAVHAAAAVSPQLEVGKGVTCSASEHRN